MKTRDKFISRTFRSRRHRALLGLCLALTLAVSAVSSHAGASNWTGGSATSGNWSDAANWSPAGPGNGDTLIFPVGVARPVNTNNLTDLVLSEIEFHGSNYVIYGNAFTLTNGLASANLAGTNLLYPALTLSNVDIGMLVGVGANLVLRGALSGTVGVTKSGGGTLTYLGSTANTYSGPTLVNEGTLELGRGLGRCIPGWLVIGDGTGGANADIVRLLSNDPMLDSADVTLNSSGLLDLNGLHDQINTLTGNGNLALNGGYLAGYSGDSFTFSGVVSGNGILWKMGAGTWTLTGNNTYSGEFYIEAGAVLVNGSQPKSFVNFGSTSATLGGTGVVGNVNVTGQLRPGDWNGPTPGLLTCSNATFTSTANYHVELNGPDPGTGYDQLKVRGTVNLANATLHATLGFASPTFHNFIIIDNDGTDPVSGTFNGLPDLAMLYINGTLFQITYVGGDGNDVVLAPQTAMQRPLLRIAPVNGPNVVLWWPTNFTGYTLEAGVDAARTAWWAATPAPAVIGTNNYVTNTVGAAQKYYRLAGPGNLPSGMALIPAGSFTMGATTNMGHESYSDEVPQHTVYVSAFYMDRNEVTKALWDEVYNWAVTNGYSFDHTGLGKAANHPVQTINWYDMVKWCNARSQKEGRTPAYYSDAGQSVVYKTGTNDLQNSFVKWNAGYRLPTEAEWEKTARGGSSGQRFPWGNTISESQANYYGDTSYSYDLGPNGWNAIGLIGGYPYTSPVGSFAPNGYGLYDMAGNVWEWCWDRYSYSYYSSSPGSDPRGPTSGSYRVNRGGGWYDGAIYCRAAGRNGYDPHYGSISIGFRSVLPPGQ